MTTKKFGYPVEFVEDVFGESPVLAKVLKGVTGSDEPRILLVADLNVVQRTEGLGAKIGRYVNAHGIRLAGSPVVIAGGEKIKADNLQSALKVVSAMLDAKLGKTDCVVVLGGGTLLDVAGYAAAQARGGVKVVRVPTTPAAMMDAAFADYAAVDSLNVKDALRVPSTPAAVLVDIRFADTVLDGVWRGGIGEAVRIAAARDAAFMRKLVKLAPAYRDRDRSALAEIVEGCVSVRAKKGPTALAGWAAARLESMSGYKLPHGYAVSIGIGVDTAYAVGRGRLAQKDREAILGVLETCGALDGLAHSRHLLGQAENVLFGLDAWLLSSSEPGWTVLSGLGKSDVEEAPDREVYQAVLGEYVSVAKSE